LEFSAEPRSIIALNMRLNPDWGGAATRAASKFNPKYANVAEQISPASIGNLAKPDLNSKRALALARD